MERRVYTIKDIQAITQLSRNTISKLIKEGHLKVLNVGKRVLIPDWALTEFLKGGK